MSSTGRKLEGEKSRESEADRASAPDEPTFLSEMVLFIVRSGAQGSDELFSIRTVTGTKTALTGRAVRDQIKDTCRRLGLPPDHFSSHSLRKGAVTHMRANGVSEDDRRDRGNYAPRSQVMNDTYDYATGLGPLASKSLPGACQPTVTDLQRIIPAARPAHQSIA